MTCTIAHWQGHQEGIACESVHRRTAASICGCTTTPSLIYVRAMGHPSRVSSILPLTASDLRQIRALSSYRQCEF